MKGKKVFGMVLMLCMVLSLLGTYTASASTQIASGNLGDNITWRINEYDSGTWLSLFGTGDMTYSSFYPWQDYRHLITKVNVAKGITSISAYAFAGFTALKSVSILNSNIDTISVGAFSGCTSLQSFSLSRFKSIGDYAFYNCINLNEPNYRFINITSIGDYAFYNCSSQQNLFLDKIESIGRYAFANAGSLRGILLSEKLTYVGDGAFDGCNINTVNYGGSFANWHNINFEGRSKQILSAADIKVSKVSVFNHEMYVGDAVRLNMDIGRATWSSSNSSIVSVDSNGKMTAKSPGTAIITAMTRDKVTVRGTITVFQRQQSTVLKYDDFGYSFINERDSFGYDNVLGYVIPYQRYMMLGYSKNEAMGMAEYWGGNCFGMSLSSILFYKNIIHEERYDFNVSRPRYFNPPDDETHSETKLRHMIELLQISQYIRNEWDLYKYVFNPVDIANELDKGNPVELEIYDNEAGHSVVIYGYTMIGNEYVFKIYDCSHFVTDLRYTDENNWKFTYSDPEYDWHPRYYFTYDCIRSIYTNIYNRNHNNAISLFSTAQEYMNISRPAEDVTIVNSLGQMSSIIDGELSGEIEGISFTPSSYLAPEKKYTIKLPVDTYTITGASEESANMVLFDKNINVRITAPSNVPLTISSDLKEITVANDAETDYSITYTTFDNIFDEMTLSGTAYGNITTKLDGTNVSVSGAKTVKVSTTVSGTETVCEAELGEGQDCAVECVEGENGTTVQITAESEALTEIATLAERLQTPAPVGDIESGSYEEGQLLTFNDDDETIIYYTTDGSEPTPENGAIYSLPIEINKSMTVKAIATKYGYENSDVVEYTYELPVVAAPTANYESGTYDSVITVEFNSADYGEIYYTTDGSDPFLNGEQYYGPIVLTEDTNFRMYSTVYGCVSEEAEFDYVIAPKLPLLISNTPTNQDGDVITKTNITTLKSVNVTVQKFGNDEVTGDFIVAFYNDKGKMISANWARGTVNEEMGSVPVEITSDVSEASSIRIFIWEDLAKIKPLADKGIFAIATEEE